MAGKGILQDLQGAECCSSNGIVHKGIKDGWWHEKSSTSWLSKFH